MSRRRAPRGIYQRLSEGTRAQRTGGAGWAYNASPISEQASAVAQSLAGSFDTTHRSSLIEQFTCTVDGAQDFTLTYLPVEDSWNVLIGAGAYQGDDFTVDGQTLHILNGSLAPLTGDVVQIQYDYLTGMPTTPDTLEVLFRWDGAGSPSTSGGNQPWTVANGDYWIGEQRNGTGSGNGFQSNCHAHKTISPAQPVLACGLAIQSSATSAPVSWTTDVDGDDFGLMSFCADSGATCHIMLTFDGTNDLQVRRGQHGTIIATAVDALPTDSSAISTWYYIVTEVKVHDSAGYVKVWVDGTQVVDFTGDTRNGGTSTNLDTLKVGGFYPTNVSIDDLYLAIESIGDPGDVTNLESP